MERISSLKLITQDIGEQISICLRFVHKVIPETQQESNLRRIFETGDNLVKLILGCDNQRSEHQPLSCFEVDPSHFIEQKRLAAIQFAKERGVMVDGKNLTDEDAIILNPSIPSIVSLLRLIEGVAMLSLVALKQFYEPGNSIQCGKTISILPFGSTGCGKSSFLNACIARKDFPELDGPNSCEDITIKYYAQFGSPYIQCYIDIPGINDSSNKDNEHFKSITEILRNQKTGVTAIPIKIQT